MPPWSRRSQGPPVKKAKATRDSAFGGARPFWGPRPPCVKTIRLPRSIGHKGAKTAWPFPGGLGSRNGPRNKAINKEIRPPECRKTKVSDRRGADAV